MLSRFHSHPQSHLDAKVLWTEIDENMIKLKLTYFKVPKTLQGIWSSLFKRKTCQTGDFHHYTVSLVQLFSSLWLTLCSVKLQKLKLIFHIVLSSYYHSKMYTSVTKRITQNWSAAVNVYTFLHSYFPSNKVTPL